MVFKKIVLLSLVASSACPLNAYVSGHAQQHSYRSHPSCYQPQQVTVVKKTTVYPSSATEQKLTTGEKILTGLTAVGLACCAAVFMAAAVKNPELFFWAAVISNPDVFRPRYYCYPGLLFGPQIVHTTHVIW